MHNIFRLLSVLIVLLLVCETTQSALASTITIGETNVLSADDSGNGNLLAAQNATLSQAATIESLSFYVTQASGNLVLGIYDASGPNGGPGALKAQTSSFTPVVGWNTANVITPVPLPAGTYWLAYLASSDSLAFMKGQTSGVSIRYYSYAFAALPATFSTSPSSDPYHWSFYATLNPAPTISSVSLSNSTFTAGVPSGTVVGAINVTMSSGSFTGSLSLSGANASSFKIVGSRLETNAVLPAGSYNIHVVAIESGASNSPLTQAATITAVSQSISSVSLSNSSFIGGSPSGTVVGAVNVTMSPSSPAFSGSLSLSTTQGGCNAANGANNSSFAITGNNLVTNGIIAPGSYAVCILATEASASNSPVGQPKTLTGGSTTVTIGESSVLSAADSRNGNLLAAQNATLPQPATIRSLSFYVTRASGHLVLGIYDASGPNGGPGALKAQTNSFTPVTGWNTANVITPVSLPAGPYWLAYLPSSSNLAFVKGLTSGISSRYYSYQFGALPAQFSTSPSSDPYHRSLDATLASGAVSQSISSISLSKSSFVGGSPSGTVVGTITVAMMPSSPAFSGSLSLSSTQGGCTATNGANNSDFAISGNNIVTNGTLAPRSYAVCILTTQAGATNSPLGQAKTITGSQSISSVSLSNSSVVGGSPSGTVVGTIKVAMSPSSPAFSGSFSLSTTQGGCTATNGANNSSFAISGNNLVTNGATAPGNGAVCILATQAGATNSPYGLALTVTVTTSATFPLTVSNGVLQTASGTPYLILGDAPQGANTLPLCSAGNTYALCQNSTDTLAGGQNTFIAYLKDRKAQGFNSLWINIVCESYTACNNSGGTQEGAYPFTAQLSGTVFSPDTCPDGAGVPPNHVDCWDMASGINTNGTATGANAAYWSHIDGYFQLAADRGMQILANPIPTDACNPQNASGGFAGGGSFGYMFLNNNTQNAAKITGYADFLVNRYKNTPNLIWFLFNDYICWNPTAWPTQSITGADTVFVNFANQIVSDEQTSGGFKHLVTTEAYGNTTSLVDNVNAWSNVVSLNGVYYNLGPPYDGGMLSKEQPASSPGSAPAVFVEGAYAGEDLGGASDSDNGIGGGGVITGCGSADILLNSPDGATRGNSAACPFRDRVQFWKLLLTGAAGYVNGNTYTWQFPTGWFSTGTVAGTCTGTLPQACLDIPSNGQLANAAAFLLAHSWYKIVPDYTRSVGGSGRGIVTPIASPFVNGSTGCYGNPCANYYNGSNYNDVNEGNPPKGLLFDRFVPSGVASDGSFAIAYVQGINPACPFPTAPYTACTVQASQQITVDNAKVNGSANLTAAWYDPTGAMTSPSSTICSPSTTPCNSGSQVYTTPSNIHSDGTADWVLLLIAPSGAVSQSISSVSLSNSSFIGGSPSGTAVGTVHVTMSPSSPGFSGSLSLSTTQGGCTAANGANNSSFAIGGNNLITNGAVAPETYAVCILATEASTSNSPVGQAVTITGTSSSATASLSANPTTIPNGSSSLLTWTSTNATSCTGNNFSTGAGNPTSGSVSVSPVSTTTYAVTCSTAQASVTVTVTGSQTISSIALSNSGTTTGLASGTAVGTLSVTLSPMTPTFSYSGTNLHLSASGADSGGVCNSTNGAGNGSFQILNGDTLATNGAITVGNKAICVTASQGAVSATGHAFTIAVGNRIDAAASFCAANGGGNGTTGSPWTTPCIVAAFNQAVNGDTVFLQAGEWMLSTDSGIAAQTGKSINLIGAGSGNTFDVYGHPNNGKGSGTGVVTHIYQNGTQLQAGVNPNFSGYIQFGLDAFQRGTACASNNSSTVAHIFFDGSQSTDGGAQWALLNTNHCPGIDFNDIRVWSWRCAGSPCSISGDIANPETQFFPWFNSNNVTVENSVMSDPPYLDVNGGYAGGQILQTQEHSFNTAKNNIFYQNQANPFFADNYTFTGNQTYEYTDGFGHANVPPAMGFAGCGPSPCGYSGQSFSPNDSVLNSLFYAIGNFMSIGGAVNDVGGGAITNTHMSGNWLIANDAYLQTCEWNHVLFGYCGPGVNPSQGEQVNQLSFTNNSLKATHSATIDLTGPGVAGGVTLTCNTCVAQHNWASTPSISNSALSDANSISPTLNSNFGWDVTSGFTTSPTVSFKLGPLGLNGVVPFTSTNFTAQYGAVQWLASTSSTPPLSSDARWTSNNGSFPANGSNVTYVPPVSLSGVTHGTTVYMWVMDSANHISATASQVIP